MAITGRFEADFSDFYAAVQKAEAKLTDFQSGAGKVETSLNRMVDSFSGRRLIQEATLSAEAIERIGGTSKLTEDELQKVAAKATEAVAKLKAMGVEVPPGIQRVANELKPANEEMGFMEKQASELGQKLLAAFAVGKIVEFALNVGKAQQQLSRLSSETQINTDDLQDLTAATADYGISNEELARALFNVQKGISGGEDSVARGLHQIGLSLEDVKGKHGKELFLEIENGLGKLQGSLRDAAAADIFGSRLGAAMAGFARETEGAIQKAAELNAKLSPAEIENLKKYADNVELLTRNLTTLKDKALGQVATSINDTSAAFAKGVSTFTIAKAVLIATLTGGVPKFELYNTLVEGLTKAADAQAGLTEKTKEETAEISKEAQASQFLSKLRLDAAKDIEPYQKRGLEDLRSMGQLNQQNAAAIGVSADQFKQYTEQVRIAELTTKSLTEATLAQNAALQKIEASVKQTQISQTGTKTEIELAGIQQTEDAELASQQRRTDALKASLVAQHADTKETIDKIDADNAVALAKIRGYYDKLKDGVGIDFNEIRDHSQKTLDDIAARALKTLVDAQSTPGVSRAEIEKLTENYRRAAFAATAMGQQSALASDKSTEGVKKTNKALADQYDLQRKLQEHTASFQVTAASFDTYTAPQGLSKSGILELLKQGFSVQNAVDVLYAKARGVNIDLSKWPEEARGPRVPGFKYGVDNFSGGSAIVGEDGPELVKLPPGSSVIPLRGGARGGTGTSIFAPIYVSGIFDPNSAHALWRVVGESMVQNVANARVLR